MIQLTDGQAIQLLSVLETVPAESADGLIVQPRHTMDQMQAQLDHPGYRDDLLAKLHDILGNVRTRSVLSSEQLTIIRKSILDPREMIRIKKLEDVPHKCTGCGCTFERGEMAVVHEQQIYCGLCTIPQAVRSANGMVEWSNDLTRYLYKMIKEFWRKQEVVKVSTAAATTTITPAESLGVFTITPDDDLRFTDSRF